MFPFFFIKVLTDPFKQGVNISVFLSLRGVFGHFDDAVFGIVLVAMMMFMPEGLIRTVVLHDIRSFFRRLFKGKSRLEAKDKVSK